MAKKLVVSILMINWYQTQAPFNIQIQVEMECLTIKDIDLYFINVLKSVTIWDLAFFELNLVALINKSLAIKNAVHDQSDLSYLIIKMIKRGCFEIIHIYLYTLSESISLPPNRLISKRSIFQNVYILIFFI